MTVLQEATSLETYDDVINHFASAVGVLNGKTVAQKNYPAFARLLMGFSAAVSRLEAKQPSHGEAGKSRKIFSEAARGHGYESNPAIAEAIQELSYGRPLSEKIWPALYVLEHEQLA